MGNFQKIPACEAAKALYLQGIPHKKIAEELGIPMETVKAWSCRQKWKLEKAGASVKASNPAKIRELGETLLGKLAQDADRVVHHVNTMTIPREWPSLERRERIMGLLTERVRTCCGLDQGTVGSIITLNIVSQAAALMVQDEPNKE